MKIKNYIPNGITLLNLLCGCIAVIFAVNGNFIVTAWFVFSGILFDFFDGFLARKLKVQSKLGIQLDSLADLVTCGVVPGLIMFQLIELAMGSWNNFYNHLDLGGQSLTLKALVPFVGLLIPLASAYRLARFNTDEDQQNYFKGLPVPANTLLIMAFPLMLEYQNNDLLNVIIVNPYFLIALTLLSCFLLNCKLKLFALKFNNWGFKNNATRYTFLMLAIVILLVLKFAGIPVIILIYILLSLFSQKSLV